MEHFEFDDEENEDQDDQEDQEDGQEDFSPDSCYKLSKWAISKIKQLNILLKRGEIEKSTLVFIEIRRVGLTVEPVIDISADLDGPISGHPLVEERTANSLENAGIFTWRQLSKKRPRDLAEIDGLSYVRIRDLVSLFSKLFTGKEIVLSKEDVNPPKRKRAKAPPAKPFKLEDIEPLI